MSFVTVAALAVGLLVVLPLAAHLLQRGRAETQVFPPLSLVQAVPAQAQQRSRIRDRALFSLRALIVLALAMLGATPLFQCSDLSVDRPGGASVALAVVLDDSHSMRAKSGEGETRFEKARDGALQLLGSLRAGDAISITLAGHPARVLLNATTDLSEASELLQQLSVSDRETDIPTAVALARSSLKKLQQPTARIVLLSDLSGEDLSGEADVITPLPELRNSVDDCGIVRAQIRSTQLELAIACSNAANTPRALSLDAKLDEWLQWPEALADRKIEPQPGVHELSFALRPELPEDTLVVQLAPGDDNPANDRAIVARSTAQTQLALFTDPERAGVITGRSTVIEQALRAVRPEGLIIHQLPVVPEEPGGFSDWVGVLLDDPAGLSPEARFALSEWVQAGGVAMALLGPRSDELRLSSSLEPFSSRGAYWEELDKPAGLDPSALGWLQEAPTGLDQLTLKGRMRLDGALFDGTHVVARWSDGAPFITERAVGEGHLFTVGLPAHVETSHLPLRPAFVLLMERLLHEAAQRHQPPAVTVGEPFRFPGGSEVRVEGPAGPLQLVDEGCESDRATPCEPRRVAFPDRAGQYQIVRGEESQSRLVRVSAKEITTDPGEASVAVLGGEGAQARSQVDGSPQLALALLILVALELVLRAVLSWRASRHFSAGPSSSLGRARS